MVLLLGRTRTRALLLLAAAVTGMMLTLQVAMVHVMTTVYAGPDAPYVVTVLPSSSSNDNVAAPSKHMRVFEPLLHDDDRIVKEHNASVLPVVIMHGMGDAAGNAGMLHVRDLIAKELQTYAVNIQIGASVADDVRNSFFMTMDEQLAVFATAVQNDKRLVNGFNAVGFSQGNLLIRGYIERYNNPRVATFVSFHGPLAGVGALPQCTPTQFICRAINKLIGDAVYTAAVQSHVAQSNYFRDPLQINAFRAHAKFLPDLNNEVQKPNATYKTHFASLKQLVLVRAEQDTQVFPSASEWFGAYADGDPYKRILGFNETAWYASDAFGLQSLARANKVHLLSTPGNHLQFTNAFLLDVVRTYLRLSSAR